MFAGDYTSKDGLTLRKSNGCDKLCVVIDLLLTCDV